MDTHDMIYSSSFHARKLLPFHQSKGRHRVLRSFLAQPFPSRLDSNENSRTLFAPIKKIPSFALFTSRDECPWAKNADTHYEYDMNVASRQKTERHKKGKLRYYIWWRKWHLPYCEKGKSIFSTWEEWREKKSLPILSAKKDKSSFLSFAIVEKWHLWQKWRGTKKKLCRKNGSR